jgi:hypothetical protein
VGQSSGAVSAASSPPHFGQCCIVAMFRCSRLVTDRSGPGDYNEIPSRS